MAILKSRIMELELCYIGYTHDWVEYECSFRVNGEPIVRDEILFRDNESWGRQRRNYCKAQDYQYDHFIPMFRRVLRTEEVDYHITMDPDLGIQVFPEGTFPIFRPNAKKIIRGEKLQREHDERKRRKDAGEQFPDDTFAVIVFIDAFAFNGAGRYHRSGIWENLFVSRTTLERFVDELEEEYLQMCKENGIEPFTEPEEPQHPTVVHIDPEADDYPENLDNLFD
ncbi:hypothetical protein [Salinispira pacifica]|uniref:Uncharacterized protein n=1 Tax=Salinispira pacifica TaxID=1307761 RepID=V5WG23_9SPIO|nr:hypothetical protein [Salinispira pacifica]AHC14111.1 hypothetical protein L21SP2_0684 [Salinispira pacifica]